MNSSWETTGDAFKSNFVEYIKILLKNAQNSTNISSNNNTLILMWVRFCNSSCQMWFSLARMRLCNSSVVFFYTIDIYGYGYTLLSSKIHEKWYYSKLSIPHCRLQVMLISYVRGVQFLFLFMEQNIWQMCWHIGCHVACH